MEKLIFLLNLLIYSPVHYGAEIFTAINDIEQAVAASRLLAQELNGYLEREEERILRLKNMINRLDVATRRYAEISEDSQLDERIANPTEIFLTIVQLASNWSDELSLLFGADPDNSRTHLDSANYEEFGFQDQMYQRLKWYSNLLPGANDINGALDAIIRLQQTYDLPAEDIASGRIRSAQKSQQLTDEHCFLLGKFAYEHDDFVHAEEWFRFVLDRFDTNSSIPSISEIDLKPAITREGILDYLSFAIGRQGKYREALEYTRILLDINPENVNAKSSAEFYEAELDNEYTTESFDHDRTKDDEMDIFKRLCRSEDLLSSTNAEMLCHYVFPHAYFTLAPLKEEIMQVRPKIVLWHDFVTQNEVDHILHISRPNLRRATVRNPITGKLEAAPYRITKNVWLPNNVTDIVRRINKRIEFATKLSMEHAEELQVANYGLGGHYAPHFDHAQRTELDTYEIMHGNRIATFMIYLTNVPEGGATVFTKTGARVRPVERSAVFWYNLLPSGDGDDLSRHGACPVLVGSKWVMNKWIREKSQEFRRPCLLHRDMRE